MWHVPCQRFDAFLMYILVLRLLGCTDRFTTEHWSNQWSYTHLWNSCGGSERCFDFRAAAAACLPAWVETPSSCTLLFITMPIKIHCTESQKSNPLTNDSVLSRFQVTWLKMYYVIYVREYGYIAISIRKIPTRIVVNNAGAICTGVRTHRKHQIF